MWKIGDSDNNSTHEEKIKLVKSALEKLPELISQVQNYEVGVNVSDKEAAFDLILLSEFKNNGDLHIYSEHPEHIRVVQFIRTLSTDVHVVDFITEN